MAGSPAFAGIVWGSIVAVLVAFGYIGWTLVDARR